MSLAGELRKLNKEQREAVDAIEGPVMVVAGPGTGKTQILTLRIANILATTDTEPESILAITFTESGVASMKKRLSQLIGAAAYQVNITTFHSFANSVIHEHADQFPHIIGSNNISEVEQVQIGEEILKKGKFQHLKPYGDPFYYLKKILSQINTLKREGVSPDEFFGFAQEEEKAFSQIEDLYHEKGAHKGKMKGVYTKQLKYIERNLELAQIYKLYAQTLKEKKLYDYADMISEVLSALEKNEELLFELQEQYQYLLVDEHQDTNNAQNRILEKLMSFHQNPNIFVVGDEKQAIFRFQGASLENFLYFQKLYPSAKLISLKSNYRSSQIILDAAHSVKKSELSTVKLKAQKLIPEKQIELARTSSPDSELYCVASSIAKKLKQGTEPSEIALLYRDNRDALDMAHMMEKLKIPFLIESDQNIFEDEDIKKLIILLQAVSRFGNEELAAQLMHADFLGIEAFDVYKLLAQARREKKRLFDLLKDRKVLEAMGLESALAMHALYTKLEAWKRKSHYQNLPALFEEIVRESGFLAHILSLSASAEKLDKLNSLFDELKSLSSSHRDYTLRDFIEYLELLKDHDLLLKKASRPKANKVRLMTAHKSKGLEFDIVYIINVFDGHWGNKKRREHFKLPPKAFSLLGLDSINTEEDERNLFYVALTRARKEVVLSYSTQSRSEKEQLESLFITEIEKQYVKELDLSSMVEEEFKKERTILFQENISKGPSLSEKEFLNELFLERGLSVTALNNYLKCPWEYFFKNLIRIPQAKTRPLMYGTAVHAALQQTQEQVREGKKPSKGFLLASFEGALEKELLSKNDFAELVEKGKKSLSSYFDTYSGSWEKDIINELDLKKIPFMVGGIEIHLTGKLDKLELSGPNLQEAKVIDYKTGKPKSENVILGRTKDSSGDMFRQLVFYKLLLDRYKDCKYEMKIGEIDFVEPDEKGRHKKFPFEILKSQVEELEEEVGRVAQEILKLDFWGRKCEDSGCEYCEIRIK